jgi:hypothetical protein
MTTDPIIRDHQEWLGYLQPDGLVVSPAALSELQVIVDRNILPLQERFVSYVHKTVVNDETDIDAITDFPLFARDFLEWPAECLVGVDPGNPIPEALTVPLPELNELLTPTFAFKDPRVGDTPDQWTLLVKTLPASESMDAATTGSDSLWTATATRRFERLLRETGISIGIITNGTHLRLVYAPRGENTGNLTFPVSAMSEVSGRVILGAFVALLGSYRLLSAPSNARLPALLKKSRDYQSTVSTELARQVLDALYELVRGFQMADEKTKGELLRSVLATNPNDVYSGLINVLLRLVFLLYAEDRKIMPSSSLYISNYAVHGLFERLRSDNERYPDTMDNRFGAWSQLLALFRAVHSGCNHPEMKMPARKGYLFDPNRYLFLEGHVSEEVKIPLVSDGVVFRVLRNLLILNGERLSYRTLDVEQIGSVYETLMGFRLEITTGLTIAFKPAKKKGAPAAINLETLLALESPKRAKWLLENTDQKIVGQVADAVSAANSADDLLAALDRKIARNATPHPVPKGVMVLQPSDERRRSGSHYTPRVLTAPIVRTTLKPILERMGLKPTPEQILALKIADIAVGSGAFVVETCRQLGDELVKSWHTHNRIPTIPPDEDEVIFAQRQIAQRCLYGVDRNPMAVDLAKLSLWLATLAKDHPFTFLDHSIKCGDSLVGLTKMQIADFNWEAGGNRVWGQDDIERRIDTAMKFRRELIEADEDFVSPELKAKKLALADEQLNYVRMVGDCVIAAFFEGKNAKERESRRSGLLLQITEFYKTWDAEKNPEMVVRKMRGGKFPVVPFHWEIEFPEVFGRENGGFDGIVGNPPFAGKNTLLNSNCEGYLDWLKAIHEESHGNADLVAHFFRRAFNFLRATGSFGLIATNTIGQGDTRTTGLRWICNHEGIIYNATKRFKWPGEAAVVVSIVNICKSLNCSISILDEKECHNISAYLCPNNLHENPFTLKVNANKSYQWSILLGMGFTFDDNDLKGEANPISLMKELIAKDSKNKEIIFPYIGGEEINDSPTHSHHRYAIDFFDRTLEQASNWPDLLSIVRTKVKPDRDKQKRDANRERWWQYAEKRPGLTLAKENLDHVFVSCRHQPNWGLTRIKSNAVFAESLIVFISEKQSFFCILQSRPHELWVRFLGSSMKDDLRYTPSDCFETFPFPLNFETNATLESIGKSYYEFRAALMIRNNEGLTKTYNRFHDRDHDGTGIESRSPSDVIADIDKLRSLHAAMDRAVLDAYGWTDINPTCEFILDYEEDEDDSDTGRRRKKPWRYKWPEEIHDEVLARLLALNATRAEEERLAGAATTGVLKVKKQKKSKSKEPDSNQTSIF